MGDKKADPMDVDGVLQALNKALRLQQRSVLQLTRGAGSMFGLEFQAVGERLWLFARSELEDTKLLVEKITALGGDPTVELAPVQWHEDPGAAIDALVESEDEAIAALHAVIPHTGQEPRSEALEHLMEHLIMRKQNQVDWLRRARRTP
ncbi:MAG TPA: ferritin-like domain-containing protein [Solirubrobacteraceae bacterium]|jgi:bacterioferritin (cytochrome b1)|nr:ferritin-like domain-containing protein [Solirubrobacteraceae bacterium]